MRGEDYYWRSFGALRESVRTGQTGFHIAYGQNTFDWFQDHPEAARLFDEAMAEMTTAAAAAIAAAYPFGSVKTIADVGGGNGALLRAVLATHAGTTTEEFESLVRDWIDTARHPASQRLYTEMVYQPMLELLVYLRANDFKTFVVSGGGVEFLRPWTQRVYGIPPEQVIGSRTEVRYELRNGVPALLRLPHPDLIDDKAGKPVGIHQVIGRRPIAAFGNSDGDFEMLEWTTSGSGPRFGLIVHHTDADREWAYDRNSHFGMLSRGLDDAPKRGWILVDMKRDWKVMYRWQK